MIDVILIEQLNVEVVSLQAMKKYLRVDVDYVEDDNLILELIASAISSLEAYANISITPKKLQVYARIKGTLYLPRGPVIEINSITNELGEELTIHNHQIQALKLGDEVASFYVQYLAGFKHIPDDIILAICKEVATNYDFRENGIAKNVHLLQTASKILIQPYSRNLLI